MVAVCVFFLAVPLQDIHEWHLYVLQSGNGLATGAAQTLMGNLGGLYGGAGQVGAVLFAGNALASLVPPIMQVPSCQLHE